MFKKLICGIALLSLTACGTGDNIQYRQSQDYDTVLMHAPNISTYPTKATAVMVGAFGDQERQYDYESFIEENASDIIAESLRKKGYHVTIVRKRDLSDKKSYREFDAVYERFVEEKNRVFTDENSSQKIYAFDIKTNLGKATSELKNKMGDDIIILSEYTESVQTSGAKAVDMLSSVIVGMAGVNTGGGRPSEMAELAIGIVDLNQNKILWTYQTMDASTGIDRFFSGASDDKDLTKQKITRLADTVLSILPDKNNLGKSDVVTPD